MTETTQPGAWPPWVHEANQTIATLTAELAAERARVTALEAVLRATWEQSLDHGEGCTVDRTAGEMAGILGDHPLGVVVAAELYQCDCYLSLIAAALAVQPAEGGA